MLQAHKNDEQDMMLQGLRVLALPVSALPLKPLFEAKDRWNWYIDLLWRYKERKIYKELVAPSGSYFEIPTMERESWEDDPRAVADIDRLISEVERATGIPVGQVVLASGVTVGSCFASSVIDLVSEPNLPQVSTKVDNLEPYRVVRRAFRFADRILNTARPDLIYCFEWADLWSYVVWLIAQSRGIPCIALRRSKIRTDHLYATTDRLMFNVAARALAQTKRSSSAGVSEAARQYIHEFQQQPKMVGYIKTKWDRRRAEAKWGRWHAQWVRSAALKIIPGMIMRPSRARELVQAVRGLLEFNTRFYRTWRHQRFLSTFDPDELSKMNYILFPVHKETDLSICFQAAPWFDQRSIIRLLASVVPNGYRLLVREHPDNYGLRPSGYYRELLELPNVVLVDPFDSQFKYIANADLVVTENGSTGWEGLLLHRKVIALSTTFYDGAGLARKLEKPEELGAAIVDMLSASDNPDFQERELDLARMIDAEHETTFHSRDAETALENVVAILRSCLPCNKSLDPRSEERAH